MSMFAKIVMSLLCVGVLCGVTNAQLTVTVDGGKAIQLVDASCVNHGGNPVNATSTSSATANNQFGAQVTVRLNHSSTSEANPSVEVGVPPGQTTFSPVGSYVPTGTYYIWVQRSPTVWVQCGKWNQT